MTMAIATVLTRAAMRYTVAGMRRWLMRAEMGRHAEAIGGEGGNGGATRIGEVGAVCHGGGNGALRIVRQGRGT